MPCHLEDRNLHVSGEAEDGGPLVMEITTKLISIQIMKIRLTTMLIYALIDTVKCDLFRVVIGTVTLH